MLWNFKLLTLVALAALATLSSGARILAIFPVQSPSHYILVTPLLQNLAQRGHEITAITPYPQKKPMKNFRDITILQNFKQFLQKTDDNQGMRDMSIWTIFSMMYNMFPTMNENIMQDPQIQKLLTDPREHFDLLIMDTCANEVLRGFATHFKVPIVTVAPFGAHTWNTDATGTPNLPSFVPFPFDALSDEMNFYERLQNFYGYLVEYFYFNWRIVPKQRELYNKYFGHTGRSYEDSLRQVALVLVNQHFTLGAKRPYMPNMIEVGGLQVQSTPNALPADMQQFLDNATEGAIYFSLGSNIKSKNLPAEKQLAILNTFRALPQKVLWKFERQNLTNVPENVFISEWYPQSDILAHPHVKLFITHGGLLSTTEAIVRGKPVLGIPFFADQHMNILRAQKSGFALTVDYNRFDEMQFRHAIQELLSNKSYAHTAAELSRQYHDKPLSALDSAIFWVEYVLRHKGAPHMRSSAADLNIFQYYSVDVILVYLAGSVTALALVGLGLWRLLKILFSIKKAKTKSE